MLRFEVAVCLVGIWLVTADSASAQGRAAETTFGSVDVSISELLERIDALQRRVDALERQLAEKPADASATPSGVDAEMMHPASSAAAQNPAEQQTQYPSLRLHGFADVNFVQTDEPTPAGFTMGQLVLHLASALGPKINVFAETSFAPRTTSGPGAAPGYAVDLERAFIRYDHSDAFKLSFGRYHTPTSYWNTAYHHGLFLQTTISRPEMIQFGRALQPVHFIGVLAEGTLPATKLGLGYSAGIGNGRASAIARAGDSGDSNDHKAWLANVFSRPDNINGLQLGVSIYRDRFRPEAGSEMNEWITTAHLAWTKETPEIIAEFANVRHTLATTGATFNTPAYYVQAAYRLPWQDARWKPYYRFDGISTPTGEPVFEGMDVRTSTLGLRYDVADFAAFKGEYRRTRRLVEDPRVNGFFLQTSFTF